MRRSQQLTPVRPVDPVVDAAAERAEKGAAVVQACKIFRTRGAEPPQHFRSASGQKQGVEELFRLPSAAEGVARHGTLRQFIDDSSPMGSLQHSVRKVLFKGIGSAAERVEERPQEFQKTALRGCEILAFKKFGSYHFFTAVSGIMKGAPIKDVISRESGASHFV